ncbi:MAG: hypothetical protein K2X93_10080 [Candidatus Obscuribacterales bacterium]|nr:hypothetical protein [Candidatus Obscuribacterales bacterium]
MRKPRSVDLQKERKWRKILIEFQASGLPFKTFCANRGLSPNTFQYWRKRLRERDEARGVQSTVRKGDNRPSEFEAKAEYWRSMLNALQEFSGSQREFCRQNGIASGTLDQWRKRLNNLVEPVKSKTNISTPLLVPVRLCDDVTSRTTIPASHSVEPRIEILLKDGNRLLVPSALPMPLLLELINGLPRS